jgi:hypothetical protein
MKSRPTNHTSAAILLGVALAFATWATSVAHAADKAGVPKPPAELATPPPIDPSTGLPLAPWIDPNWKDPDKILPEVVYDGLPIGEVVRHLRQEFKGEFDVLIPSGWQDPHNRSESVDPQSASIKMQLKNVTASEVFNAMNLVFEAENAPYRWELKLNGNRPTAMLRVLPQYLPIAALPPPPPAPLPPKRLVYFVGDMIDGGKSDGMTIEKLVKTVTEVYEMSYGPSKGVIQFHKDAQLIIANGTVEQVGFIQLTLSALAEKVRADRMAQQNGSDPKPKPGETKAR